MNVLLLPPHARSRLITKPSDKRVPSPQRSTDATTALTRGIAEYVAGLSIATPDGRALQFRACFDAWAEPEDEAQYPSFVAYTAGQVGEYEAAAFTPRTTPHRYPDGSYEVSGTELTVTVICEVWATDPEGRKALVLMLEEGFAPVEWMEGFRLELPHYFNQRASYLPVKVTYEGDAGEALARFVKARIEVVASVPRTRVIAMPEGRAEVRVEVGNDVDLNSKS